MVPRRFFPAVRLAAHTDSGGRRHLANFRYSMEAFDILQEAIGRINGRRSGKERVNMDDLATRIYYKTGEVIPTMTLERHLSYAEKPFEIVWGQLNRNTSVKGVEERHRAILIHQKIDFSKIPLKFKDGWYFDLETHFRKHGEFPYMFPFKKRHGPSLNKAGFEKVRGQIVEYYWKTIAKSK